MEHIDWTYTNGNGHIDQHEFNECGKPYLDATLLGSGHCFNPSLGQNYELLAVYICTYHNLVVSLGIIPS